MENVILQKDFRTGEIIVTVKLPYSYDLDSQNLLAAVRELEREIIRREYRKG